MSVTVIIPTLNRPGFIKEAIVSILEQTVAADEILVIDDGSEDSGTRLVVKEFEPRVRYIWKQNGGKSSALNLGMTLASGDNIWVFDDDDVAEADALRRLVEALDRNPGCGFSYGRYDKFRDSESGARTYEPATPYTPTSENILPDLLDWFFLFQPGMLTRRSCYDAVGPFDVAYRRSQDHEMALRLASRFQGAFVDAVVFHQRQHAGARGIGLASDPDAIERRWAEADQMIFRKLHGELPLSAYRHQDAMPDVLLDRLARARVFARKGLWSEAGEDLKAVLLDINARSATGIREAELRQLHGVLEWDSRGMRYLERAIPFRAAFSALTSRFTDIKLRSNLILPLLHQLKRPLLRRDWGELGRTISALRIFGGPVTLVAAIILRLRRGRPRALTA